MSLFAMFKSAGADRLRLRVDGGTGHRRALARQPDDSGDGRNSGIGHEACRVLALRGALVLGTARTKEKAAAACATVCLDRCNARSH